jgi:nicotinamidase-related amidase
MKTTLTEAVMNIEEFIEQSKPFLNYVVTWKEALLALPMSDLVGIQPERVAVISVDIINGFCYEGPLASPRVARLVEPITNLFNKSYVGGIRNFLLTQDAHRPDSVEFDSYPPHCICGSVESETVAAFRQLPFWNLFRVIPKPSIHSGLGTDLDSWLAAHPEVETFIVVGDCTDLCTYQLAMHLKLRAVAANRRVRVLLPANCVDTYDLPVATAQTLAAVPHDGELLHHIFLYSMMLNGIEVVDRIM